MYISSQCVCKINSLTSYIGLVGLIGVLSTILVTIRKYSILLRLKIRELNNNFELWSSKID